MTATRGQGPAPKTMQETVQGRRPAQPEQRRDQAQLAGRYGAIGISAVAAALRYAGVAKNPAYAPVVHGRDARFAELAA